MRPRCCLGRGMAELLPGVRAGGVSMASDITGFIESLDTDYLVCRELGHQWPDAWAAKRTGTGYLRGLKCQRCDTERWQKISRRGEIKGTYMKYPDGYLATGMGRIIGEDRWALRVEALERKL